MNERLAEMELFNSLVVLERLGVSTELLATSHTAIGKSDALFLSTVKEVTIKLRPPADWGCEHE